MQNSYDNQYNKEQAEYAGFWVRLAAYLIDSVIVFAGLLIVRLILAGVMAAVKGTVLGGNILFHYNLKDIVLYVCEVLYFILFTYYTGTTIGKKAMNLRVVRADGSEKLGFLTVLYRETVGRFLSGVILSIGYLMIGIDKEKRGLHDILCDTRVIYAKKIKVFKIEQVFTPMGQPMGVNTPQPMDGPENAWQREHEDGQENVVKMPWEAPYTGAGNDQDNGEDTAKTQPDQKFAGYRMVKPEENKTTPEEQE